MRKQNQIRVRRKTNRCSWARMAYHCANVADGAVVAVVAVAVSVGKADQVATPMVARTQVAMLAAAHPAAAMPAAAQPAAAQPAARMALRMVAPIELGATGAFGYAPEVSNLGALRVTQRDEDRLELSSGRLAFWFGWTLCAVALVAAWWVFAVSTWLAGGCGVLASFAALFATAERRVVFDRAAGVVIVSQRIVGISTKSVVPLFHLRAVVVKANGNGFVAYLDRRLGENIELERDTTSPKLVALAQTIARSTGLRYVFNATKSDV